MLYILPSGFFDMSRSCAECQWLDLIHLSYRTNRFLPLIQLSLQNKEHLTLSIKAGRAGSSENFIEKSGDAVVRADLKSSHPAEESLSNPEKSYVTSFDLPIIVIISQSFR